MICIFSRHHCGQLLPVGSMLWRSSLLNTSAPLTLRRQTPTQYLSSIVHLDAMTLSALFFKGLVSKYPGQIVDSCKETKNKETWGRSHDHAEKRTLTNLKLLLNKLSSSIIHWCLVSELRMTDAFFLIFFSYFIDWIMKLLDFASERPRKLWNDDYNGFFNHLLTSQQSCCMPTLTFLTRIRTGFFGNVVSTFMKFDDETKIKGISKSRGTKRR